MRILLLAGTALMGVSVSIAAAVPANATAITGSISFSGGFASNGYDPASGGVPSGYGNTGSNTVSVGPGVEFGFQDQYNRDTADFSGSNLVLTDNVLSAGASSWQQHFVADTPGYFSGISLAASSFMPSLTFSSDANSLTVNWGGEYSTAPATFSATFNLAGVGATSLTASSVQQVGSHYDYSYDLTYSGATPGTFLVPLIGISDIIGIDPMAITPEYTTDFGTAFHYVAAFNLAAGANTITFESQNSPIEGPVGIYNGSYVTTVDPPIPGGAPGLAVPEPTSVLALLIGTAALAAAGRRRITR